MTFKKFFFFINCCFGEEMPTVTKSIPYVALNPSEILKEEMPNVTKSIPYVVLNPSETFKKFNKKKQLQVNGIQRFLITLMYLTHKYKFFFFSGSVIILLSEFQYPLEWALINLITKPFLFLMIRFWDSKVEKWYSNDEIVHPLIIEYQKQSPSKPKKLGAKATEAEKKTYQTELKAYEDLQKVRANERKKILDTCLSDKNKFTDKILVFTSFLVAMYGAIFLLRYLTSLNNGSVKDRLIRDTIGSMYTKLDIALCFLYFLGGYGVIFFVFQKSLIRIIKAEKFKEWFAPKKVPGLKSPLDIKENLINFFKWIPLIIIAADFINSIILFKQLPAFLKEYNQDIIGELFTKEQEIQIKAMLIEEAKEEKLRKIQEAKDKKEYAIQQKLEKENQQKLEKEQKLEEENQKQKELSRIQSKDDDQNSQTRVIDPPVSAYHQQEYINDMGNGPDFVYDSYGNQQPQGDNNGNENQNSNEVYNEYGY